ncbi:DUF2975 domain-containing protein [Tamlana agarivorans]|uniref:DUF2975 domain-containing protein n=1 Tax=Pseudotamlana agarivorans TaxID=481183 RepID=A0ACC5UB78_9FLAO|nr:DUF2975 domain-containing protein [Tamlana agarivorans]MBU2951499.1 DUF2975 domain-containing protein [Tamlana agarivorans]
MKKNTLLNVAIIICKSLRLIYILIFLIVTGLFVHFQWSPSTYDNLDLTNFTINNIDIKNKTSSNKSFINKFSSYKIHVDGKVPSDSEVFVLNKLKYKSLYINFIQCSAIFILLFLVTKEFEKIIKSVKQIKTFHKNNVISFRKIGKYLLILFVLSSYSALTFQQGGMSSLHLIFSYLILALLAYIMAAIFEEGNNLSEENKLTV